MLNVKFSVCKARYIKNEYRGLQILFNIKEKSTTEQDTKTQRRIDM
jgi:hypothetical protein